MSGNLRLLGPNANALVEVGSFEADVEFQKSWTSSLPRGYEFLSDHYWRFMQDPQASAASAVGLVMFGVIARYPEFRAFGTASCSGTRIVDGVEHQVGFLGIDVESRVPILDRDRKTATLVDATNETLLAVNSPFHLPLTQVIQ